MSTAYDKFLESLKPDYKPKRVGTDMLTYSTFTHEGFRITTPASSSPVDVFQATVYDIERIKQEWGIGNVTFTVCPACKGHLFHKKHSSAYSVLFKEIKMGSCGCPCGQTVKYVGGGGVGEAVGERNLQGIYYI